MLISREAVSRHLALLRSMYWVVRILGETGREREREGEREREHRLMMWTLTIMTFTIWS